MKRLPPTLERIVAGVALGLVFLVMASVFAPDFSRADSGPDALAEPSTDPHEGLLSLGTIESERYLIRIHAGPEGPLYSVYDRTDERELGVLLTAEQVGERFPEAPLPAMDFGTFEIGMVDGEL